MRDQCHGLGGKPVIKPMARGLYSAYALFQALLEDIFWQIDPNEYHFARSLLARRPSLA
jgi:hypothetical protein